MKPFTYLLVNIACIIIPFVASFYPKHAFYKDWKPFIKANILVGFLFVVWDYFFTKAGIWGFNEDYITGIHLGNLPIEEVLFFICIPYACVFSYFAFQYVLKRNPLKHFHRIVTYILITLFLVIGVLNINKLYTSITFLSTGLFLTFLIFRKVNLSYHYLNYGFILPFFVLSNGVLTGSFLVEPIVWYDDSENLGIRLFNIPVEDSVYGMLLIFMNIELYNYFKHKK